MSRRQGTSITSPLFMAHPISDTVVPNNNINHIYTKGMNGNISYEHIGGEDGEFIVHKNGVSYRFHRKTLIEYLRELRKVAHTPTSELSPALEEAYRNVVEATRVLEGVPDIYTLVLNDANDVFADVKDAKHDTVGAFFIGCFRNNNSFAGPIGCNPRCAASLAPLKGTPNYTHCDSMVLVYENNHLKVINDMRSERAYVYVQAVDFNGFSTENTEQLKEAGVKTVTLIYGGEDGNYREVINDIPVENLPVSTVKSESVSDSTVTTTASSGVGIFFLVVVIIAFLFLLAWMIYNYPQM